MRQSETNSLKTCECMCVTGHVKKDVKGKKDKSSNATGERKRDAFLAAMGLDAELASEWLDTHALQSGYIPSFQKPAASSSTSSGPHSISQARSCQEQYVRLLCCSRTTY